jgi:hypothetical protein
MAGPLGGNDISQTGTGADRSEPSRGRYAPARLGRIAILVGVIPAIRITRPTLVSRPVHREG